MDKLKPCPFCGGTAQQSYVGVKYMIFCKDCRVQTPPHLILNEAITAWNCRPCLVLEFGKGNFMVADYSYDDINTIGVCAYKNPLENPALGQTDTDSAGKTTEEVGAILKLEFTNTQSIDVWIRALERAKETALTRAEVSPAEQED